jgi:hypothetical protein
MLVVTLAIGLAGCGREDDRQADRPDRPADTDPRTRALGRLPDGMSAEVVEALIAKMKREYPPTGQDMWALADDILANIDNLSDVEFEKSLRQGVLAALRVRAENIFAVVCVGRDPPGTDDLKFAITNRTGRKVSEIAGVIQILNRFGAVVESLKAKVEKPISPGGQAACAGHWPMPAGLLGQLAAADKRYQLKFVARSVTYADGTVEEFP